MSAASRPIEDRPSDQPRRGEPERDPGAELVDLSERTVAELLTAEADATLPDPARPSRPPARRRAVLAARLAASLAMLGILYWRMPDFDPGELVPEWTSRSGVLMVGAFALTAIAIVLSALRWQKVLEALDMPTALRRLVPLYFAGQFVSNVLPTTVGGDVLRVSRLSKDNGDAPDTFASVVLERLSGWLVLPLITFIGLTINPGLWEFGRTAALAAFIALGTLAALVAILVLADHRSFGGRYTTAQGWRRFVGAVHLGVGGLRHHPWATTWVIVVGIAYQFVLCLAALLVAEALGINDMGLTPLLAYFPAVLIAQVLPIGIAGLGIREAAFVIFLTPLGVPAEQAVALGLVLYLVNVAVSLLGVPFFAVGGRGAATAR
ncbi:MAG: flippase-like domain-containing protein [Acidimicrobiales bacterium]|jgi:hypothetical protein|nr:flippase-like domain-containing protein [Acidimicrobiales bacterium]